MRQSLKKSAKNQPKNRHYLVTKPGLTMKAGNRKIRIKPLSQPAKSIYKRSKALRKTLLTGFLAVSVNASVKAELPVPAAVWASLGHATHQTLGNTLNINQQSDKVILNWDSFNVGRNNQVNFKQPSRSAIALNRIFQDDPSRILGRITANGQIYLFNKNGFVFGKDSVVNVNTLVASALNITEKSIQQGIAKVFQENNGAAAFDATLPEDYSGTAKTYNPARFDASKASIRVEQGAQIQTPDNGLVLLAAPKIENQGTVAAGKVGQIIMVASKDKVYLQDAKSNDYSGMLVEVGQGGELNNLGNIVSRQGNITLMGFAVNQQGRVSATTSAKINGSIRLLAREGQRKLGDQPLGRTTTRTVDAGDGLGTEATVTFGEHSVTEILPENSNEGVVNKLQQPPSYIEAAGFNIHMKKAALLHAPAGKVVLQATNTPRVPGQGAKGRVVLENGSRIDVAGLNNGRLPMASNVLKIDLTTFDLRDSPLQRNGILKGATVRVDKRIGSPLFEISAALSAVKETAVERNAKGGKVSIISDGDFDFRKDASIDISGGSVKFDDGYIKTTNLLSQGHIINIGEASPNLIYDGILGQVTRNFKKWNIKRTFITSKLVNLGRFERGYRKGFDAGALQINSKRTQLNGNFISKTVHSRFQREQQHLPFGGSFELVTGQDINWVNQLAVPNPLRAQSLEQLLLSDTLYLGDQFYQQSGVQQVKLTNNSFINVAADARVLLNPGGSLHLGFTDDSFIPVSRLPGHISINGQIRGAGGTVTAVTRQEAGSNGKISIARDAVIDVSGGFINDQFTLPVNLPTEPLLFQGGNVNLKADGDLVLAAGSLIKADGGAWIDRKGQLQAGKGGVIKLAADNKFGSSLLLDGRVQGFGLLQGGALELLSNEIIISGQVNAQGQVSNPQLTPLRLEPGFFNHYGFQDFKLTGRQGVTLAEHTALNLRAKNTELLPTTRLQDNRTLARQNSTDDFSRLTRIIELPDHLRKAVNLTLIGGPVILKTGSVLSSDPLGRLEFISNRSIFSDAHIIAHGGQVTMHLTGPSLAEIGFIPEQAIWLGKHNRIDVSGMFKQEPSALALRQGEILPGGTVSVKADRGFVVMQQGSIIDISGATAEIDVIQRQANQLAPVLKPVKLAGRGGRIDITAAEGVVLDGEMRAHSGGDFAAGGHFSLSLDRSKRNIRSPFPIDKVPFNDRPLTLSVRQNTAAVLPQNLQFGDAIPDQFNGKAQISAQQLTDAGFDFIHLASREKLRFIDNVALNPRAELSLDAPLLTWQSGDAASSGKVLLNSAYVALQSSQARKVKNLPLPGGGELSVSAQWIDLFGGISADHFSGITLHSQRDIRLNGLRLQTGVGSQQKDYVGEFITAGDLTLQADQIYPATLSQYRLAIKNNPAGILTTLPGHTGSQVLSAGGSLGLDAPFIRQGGTLLAPFGTIRLTASDSIVFQATGSASVSGRGLLVPFGITQGGIDWLYPLDQFNNKVITTAPEKAIVLKAANISYQPGSRLDISGGGDLFASEFVPGLGGTADFLDPAGTNGSYAIMPQLGTTFAPFDPFLSPGSGLSRTDSIFIAGMNGLPAGNYALLPSRYALLPGAFLITPIPGSKDFSFASKQRDIFGGAKIAGYRSIAGTPFHEARSSAFLVQPGTVALQHSQFRTTRSNSFFVGGGENNAGKIQLQAAQKLNLDVQVQARGINGGRDGVMDITADALSIVQQADPANTGVLQLEAQDLDQLGVGSLLLGGRRELNSESGLTTLNFVSDSLTVAENVKLRLPEIMLAATDKLEIAANSSIKGIGRFSSNEKQLQVIGDGAVLRASSVQQVEFSRQYTQNQTPGQKGDLMIAAGTSLDAEGSLLLDSSKSTTFKGSITMQGGSLHLGSKQLLLGAHQLAPGVDGMAISSQDFSRLNVAELILASNKAMLLEGPIAQLDANSMPLRDAQGALIPLSLQNLRLIAPGISAAPSVAAEMAVTAKRMELQSGSTDTKVNLLAGNARMQLSADALSIQGHFYMDGFSDVGLDTGQLFSGQGSLTTSADTLLTTPGLTLVNGGEFKLTAPGHNLTVTAGLTNAVLPSLSLGAQLQLIADNINFNTNVRLESGTVTLEGVHDVNLGKQAVIDVSGKRIGFADVFKDTDAGQIKLHSGQGNITMAESAKLILRGGGESASSGSLKISASQGTAHLHGHLDAAPGVRGKGGQMSVDVQQMADADFSKLAVAAGNSGFTQSFSYRQRRGDVLLNQRISAQQTQIMADQGTVSIANTIDATGAEGGTIEVYAGDQVKLQQNAELLAFAQQPDGAGGSVLLASLDSDNDGISGIKLDPDARINVGGATKGAVTLRAQRDTSGINSLIIDPIGNTVVGADKVIVEAVQVYKDADLDIAGQLQQSDYNVFRNDSQQFMTAVMTSHLAQQLGNQVEIRPGVEVLSQASLLLKDKLDLSSWRFNDGVNQGIPGQLIIRSAGDLLINQSISDGFSAAGINTDFGLAAIENYLQSGASWSYILTAGADLQAANPSGVIAQQALFKVGSNVKVRSGTGDIAIHSGGDVALADQSSVIYSAGHAVQQDRYGAYPDLFPGFLFYVEYPEAGGDIKITAENDITGAQSDQFITDWLLRLSTWTGDGSPQGEFATTWGIAFDKPQGANYTHVDFQQNIASFAGGQVNIQAGRNIRDLSVMLPNTGKQQGAVSGTDALGLPVFANNDVKILGTGSRLEMTAGGDIQGGAYYVGSGTAELKATGGIIGGGQFSQGPVFALSDAQIALQSGSDLQISGALDPMILPKNRRGDRTFDNTNDYFFSYAPDSSLALTSLTGDINLNNNVTQLNDKTNLRFGPSGEQMAEIFPASLQVQALVGNILLQDDIGLFPSSQANLELLAGRDILSNKPTLKLYMSDADRALLPDSQVTVDNFNFNNIANRLAGFGLTDLVHATLPVHQNATEPARIVAGGDIKGNGRFRVFLPKQALVSAGHDLTNVDLHIQHGKAGAVSVLSAGHDILFPSTRDANGRLINTVLPEISIEGSGRLDIIAGHNVDLGASGGVLSKGNSINTVLPENGADLTILAGLGKQPAYEAFIASYFDKDEYHQQRLSLQRLQSDSTLSTTEQQAGMRELVFNVFFNELKTAGSVAAVDKASGGNQRGFAAIKTLFPDPSFYQGDVKLFFSTIQTQDGGDINLVAPGGLVNAGLAVSFAGARDSSDLGIVAKKQGDINIFTDGDVQVNTTRIFTLDGGDILTWSTNGDIDAGRGAKSALSAAPPNITVLPDGKLSVEFPPLVSGSGIRAEATSPGIEPGDVTLIAPRGVVDAGEAGIGGNNITIAAVEVIGADNIDVGGVSVGVPSSSNVSVAASLTGVSNIAASVSKDATESVTDNTQNAGEMARSALGILSVKVLGFASE